MIANISLLSVNCVLILPRLLLVLSYIAEMGGQHRCCVDGCDRLNCTKEVMLKTFPRTKETNT